MDFNKLLTHCRAADQFIACITEKRKTVYLAIISNSVFKLGLVDFDFSLLLSFLNHLLLPDEPLCWGRPFHAHLGRKSLPDKKPQKMPKLPKSAF